MKRVLVLYFFVVAAIFVRIHTRGTSVPAGPLTRHIKKSDPGEQFSGKKEEEGEKKDGYWRYAEFHKQLRTPDHGAAPSYVYNYQLRELQKTRLNASGYRTAATTLEWKSRGPGNIPGRTRSLAVLPQDATGKSWLAGSVGGGVWKTVDAGASWTNITPDLPNLAISSLAVCTSSPSVIYAGTGEAFGNLDGIGGAGIFKTTDGGSSWVQLTSTVADDSFRAVNRIIVDPANSDIVVACSNTSTGNFSNAASGIFRSDDGGASWTKVYTSDAYVQQVIAAPTDFQVQYASVYGVGVLKSTDGGKTWVSTSGDIKAAGRIELAVSSKAADKIAASVVGNLSGEAGADLYFSIDGGASWAYVSEEGDNNFDFLGQGDYDNTIMFHPFDDNIVYVGGVDIFKFHVNTTNPGQIKTVDSFEKTGTTSFIDFVPFSGNDLPGLELGGLESDTFVDVEVRFGPGVEQKAARFTVNKQGAGVPANEYQFKDYITVPFQVWDVTNNRQLMASFRDQQEDGAFNLIASNTEGGAESHSREYFFVHLLEYAEAVNPDIAKNGGHEFEMMLNFWPVLASGGVWDSQNLPDSKLTVSFSAISKFSKTVKVVADGYGEYTGLAGGNVVNPTGSIHVDHHSLTAVSLSAQDSTFRIVSTNDGGVFYSVISKDPGTTNGDWTFAGNGMVTGQYYGVDRRFSQEQYIGGLQDNSTSISATGETPDNVSDYKVVIGGDGFETIWNNADESLIVASAQFNNFYRSQDHGLTWQLAVSGLPLNYEEEAPFFSRLSNSRSIPEVLFAVGVAGVYRSVDFGERWSLSKVETEWSYRGSFTNVEVSKSNPLIVWAGGAMSGAETLQVSTDRGETFKKVSHYSGNAGLRGVITGIESHPLEDSTAFALFSFQGLPKVLRTKDLGANWQDISGFETSAEGAAGFPDVAVYSLVVLPNDPSIIWAGTEIGIYETSDDGKSWTPLQGFPAVAVWEMKVVNDEVVIATHGRGIWTAKLAGVPAPVLAPLLKSLGIKPSGAVVAEVDLRTAYDSSQIIVNEIVKETLASNAVGTVTISLPAEGDEVQMQVKSFKEGKPYLSIVKSATAVHNAPLVSYFNNFDGESGLEDFYGNGFSITKPVGFQSKAIHSSHPYADDATSVYYLKTPVIIDESNASFRYRDIALIEEGEPEAAFGDEDFYDFVVVEGSVDGANWRPLADGYDASFNEGWSTVHGTEGGTATEVLYVQHQVDLLQNFSHGDTVSFRFRLFADQLDNGWGWAVDDLNIQTEGMYTGIKSNPLEGTRLYPVPVEDHLTVELGSFIDEPATFSIMDLSGKIFLKGEIKPRIRQSEVNASNLRPGIYLVTIQTSSYRKTLKLIKQ